MMTMDTYPGRAPGIKTSSFKLGSKLKEELRSELRELALKWVLAERSGTRTEINRQIIELNALLNEADAS